MCAGVAATWARGDVLQTVAGSGGGQRRGQRGRQRHGQREYVRSWPARKLLACVAEGAFYRMRKPSQAWVGTRMEERTRSGRSS